MNRYLLLGCYAVGSRRARRLGAGCAGEPPGARRPKLHAPGILDELALVEDGCGEEERVQQGDSRSPRGARPVATTSTVACRAAALVGGQPLAPRCHGPLLRVRLVQQRFITP